MADRREYRFSPGRALQWAASAGAAAGALCARAMAPHQAEPGGIDFSLMLSCALLCGAVMAAVRRMLAPSTIGLSLVAGLFGPLAALPGVLLTGGDLSASLWAGVPLALYLCPSFAVLGHGLGAALHRGLVRSAPRRILVLPKSAAPPGPGRPGSPGILP